MFTITNSPKTFETSFHQPKTCKECLKARFMRMNVQSIEMLYFCTYMHASVSIELDAVCAFHAKLKTGYYGISGCGVFNGRIQN